MAEYAGQTINAMQNQEKIKSIDELADELQPLRAVGQRIVQCHGVFDLLHIGHIRYLQRARRLGDVLIVTVTPDRFVNKGPHRPAFQEQLRLDALAALDCVDFVALNDWPTAVETIGRLRPTVFAKGAEFRDRKTPELLREEEAATAAGTTVEYIDDVTSSSTQLINTYLSPFSADTERYLAEIRQRYSADEILAHLAGAGALKVLVVGEAMIDEYYYCSAIGRSAKAPVVATKYESHERFAGGALAVANHIAQFCDNVHLYSMLGEDNSEEDWVREQLHGNISAEFFFKKNAPTIVRRRYHESYFNTTMFAINFLNDDPLQTNETESIVGRLKSQMAQYDAVVVADYGLSLFGPETIRALTDEARFLCVHAQANEANLGFHTIAKYDRADYASLARQDLELECRERGGDLRSMLGDVARRLSARTMAVTLGKQGCLCYNQEAGFHEAAGLSTTVVDRMGAAEAFFAISSLCAAAGAPTDVVAFCGNVAGAEAAAVTGTSPTIDELAFRRHVESLLK